MRQHMRLILAVGLLALLLAAGLGCGSSSNNGGNTITTGVSGQVVDVDSQLGIGNMVVTVGGIAGVSTTPNGVFTVAASAGAHQLLTVQPSALFVQVPGPAIYVDVVAGQVTALSGPLLVADRNSLPPSG